MAPHFFLIFIPLYESEQTQILSMILFCYVSCPFMIKGEDNQNVIDVFSGLPANANIFGQTSVRSDFQNIYACVCNNTK